MHVHMPHTKSLADSDLHVSELLAFLSAILHMSEGLGFLLVTNFVT